MNNSSASTINSIAELSVTCKQCSIRFGTVVIVEAVSPVLVSYAIAIKPNFCASCGFHFSKPGRKTLSVSSEIIFEDDRRYDTEEIAEKIGLIYDWTATKLRQSRKNGELKYKKVGSKNIYLGKDLNIWYAKVRKRK